MIHDTDDAKLHTLLDLASQVASDLGHGRVSAGPPDPTGCDLVCNATPLGMEDDDTLALDP